MEKRKDKNVSLSTVIENREVELKVHRTDERALLRFSSECTDVSDCRPHFYKMVRLYPNMYCVASFCPVY